MNAAAASGRAEQPAQDGPLSTETVFREVLSTSNGSDSFVEARHVKKGALLAEVVRCSTGSVEKLLGHLKFALGKNNHASMNAVCKIHTSCQCWVSNETSSNLLLQWLVEADTCDRDDHQTLAKDLKRSLGMRIR